MSEAAKDCFAFIDKYTEAMTNVTRARGKPVTCKTGCFHCCKEPVMAERMEAEHLVSMLTKPGEREQISLMVENWWNLFFNGKHDKAPPVMEQNGSDLARYRLSGIWCPFLKGGLCSQYASRPVSCRLHLAIGPWRKCAEDTSRPKQIFIHSQEESEIMLSALGRLCENSPQAFFQFDHLGIWLGHLLLGKSERSNAAHDMIIKQTEPR